MVLYLLYSYKNTAEIQCKEIIMERTYKYENNNNGVEINQRQIKTVLTPASKHPNNHFQ